MTDLSAGATDLSTFSGCGSGLGSNWNEIGWKYKLRYMTRWVPGFKGTCPLPIVCTSSAKEQLAGASTISLQITLGRRKANGQDRSVVNVRGTGV